MRQVWPWKQETNQHQNSETLRAEEKSSIYWLDETGRRSETRHVEKTESLALRAVVVWALVRDRPRRSISVRDATSFFNKTSQLISQQHRKVIKSRVHQYNGFLLDAAPHIDYLRKPASDFTGTSF